MRRPEVLATTLAAAGILMVTMGARQSLGLFIGPIDATTGLGLAAISLALAIGQFTWLATVPPTAAIVGKLFGIRYLATLFGVTLLSHQIGGFFGAYLGGVTMTRFGDYGWMWYADMTLAALAAILNLPIREAPMVAARTLS